MEDLEGKMKKAVEALEREFASIRTGRANPAILDRVAADYYGARTPIKNMANISIADGRTLYVQAFDKGSLKDIEKAIQDSGLGLTPTNDGNRLIISIPELTKQRREELAKIIRKEAENAKVTIRNARRDAIDLVKKQTEVSEDQRRKDQDDIQKQTDKFVAQVETLADTKEKEIMTI
jgi:ribosome recycling factor